MKRSTRNILMVASVLLTMLALGVPLQAHAQRMPQDFWTHDSEIVEANTNESFRGIAAGPDGLLYVGVQTVSNQTVAVFDSDGVELRRFGSFDNLHGIAVNSQNEVHVFDLSAPNKIRVFDTNGNPLREWGSVGTGDGQFASTFSARYGVEDNFSLLSISPNGTVYALDADHYRVQSFTGDGSFITNFGSQGDFLGQFSDKPTAIACLNDESICVGDLDGGITMFNSEGSPLTSIGGFWSINFAASCDGLLVVQTERGYAVYDVLPNNIVQSDNVWEDHHRGRGVAINKKGTMFFIASEDDSYDSPPQKIYKFIRKYGETDAPLVTNPLPQPQVIRVAQRAGTTLLDIDYQIVDADSGVVEAYPLGFADGGDSLSSILPMNTFMEGTETNFGAAVEANVEHRITWSAAADWSTDFGQLKVEILANDGRNLLPFHWITLPTNGVDPEITISADPVTNNDLKSVWFWLIAKGDPSVQLLDGEVLGVGGAYDGVIFASGTSTTASGRQFLYEMMSVRAITDSELTRAQSGNYNFNSLSTDSIVKLP